MLDAIWEVLCNIGNYFVNLAKFAASAFVGVGQFIDSLGKGSVIFQDLVSRFFPLSIWVTIAGMIAIVVSLAVFRLITRFL